MYQDNFKTNVDKCDNKIYISIFVFLENVKFLESLFLKLMLLLT